MLLTSLGAVALLLLVSAFFSGSETAMTAVSRGRMHQLEKDGSRAARDVNRLVANREKLIGALLLGNTFINILASSLMTSASMSTNVTPSSASSLRIYARVGRSVKGTALY